MTRGFQPPRTEELDERAQSDSQVAQLPNSFCWSRFGTEAGETIEKILQRKETERERNNGVFLWGIGNALGPSMRELVRREAVPEVIFSPIRSKPRLEDVTPASTVVWTVGRDLSGVPCPLPSASVVTSRYSSTGTRAQRHYALVCHSENPLAIAMSAPVINFGLLRNLLSNNVVGASQVTAVVRHEEHATPSRLSYLVAMRFRLVAPYLIELFEPKPHPGDARAIHPALPLGRQPDLRGLLSLAAHTN
jgi:hypothetical protein